ncbi:Beta-hexosaminidase [Pichia kudriavzevii]|uniref:Beta-hexosaminidase n=1 Tax=Pichia kudriavzevii TaxID=4909 RepID=A0A1V2LMQ5_PICKU|nr:Beta-hexosaminidase [Pichia kudriavzevii]
MLALNRKRAISSDEDCTYKQEKKQTIDQTKEVDESDQEHDERESYYRRLVGNFFMVGFEGTSVNEEIASLISKYYIGNLQAIAKNSGYKYPIIFVIDEEGGMLNSLFDREFVTQFPGAMAMGAAGSVDLTYKVYRSIAKELKSIGFSMYLGPVLDILKYRVATFIQQMIGVRAYGYNAQSVVEMGRVAAKAFKDEQLFNCGKHFPGYGSATINSNFELPMILESTEQLFESSLIPYMELIKEDLLDSILVGGCAVPGGPAKF